MSEKEEVLQQISDIKNHLVDKQPFFPYNYNAIFVWSAIALFLTLFMVPMYEKGVIFGSIVVTVLMTLGFISEGVMTKKVNRSYDIEECTLRQRFIMRNFMMISFFLIVLSATLATYKLYIPIYLTWLFLISLGYFAVGFVLNIKWFTYISQFNIYLAITLLAFGWQREHLVGSDSICFRLVQAAVIFGLSIVPAIIAWKQKKEL
ncbi:MAG: hypothetical protein ABFQ64_10575 [Campylobacterota bacterium]